MEKGTKQQKKDGLDAETLDRCFRGGTRDVAELEKKVAGLRERVKEIEAKLADPKLGQSIYYYSWYILIRERNSLLVDVYTTETKIDNLRKGRPSHGEQIHEVSIGGI